MLTPPTEEAARLSTSGWAFMLLSMAFVWGLALTCYRRVLRGPTPADPVKDFHSA
jgi:hypothetical protein